MTTRREFIKKTVTGATVFVVSPLLTKAESLTGTKGVSRYVSQRPEKLKRNFVSVAVDETIDRVKAKIEDPKLAWCLRTVFNTLDTTVRYGVKAEDPTRLSTPVILAPCGFRTPQLRYGLPAVSQKDNPTTAYKV